MKKSGPLQAFGLLLGLILFLPACSRSASTPSGTLPPPPGPEQWAIMVQSVQVTTNASIEINGEAILPSGGCVQTRLLEDGQPVSWWPQDTCIQPDTRQQWQMVVPLGRKGAPEALNPQVEYEIEAWWPEQPNEIQAHFPFDLQPPP